MGNTWTVGTTVSAGVNYPYSRFAQQVNSVLQDSRGWRKRGYRFRWVPYKSNPHIRIKLTSAAQMKHMFPQFEDIQVSVCDMKTRRIYLREDRWLQGVPWFPTLAAYRMYLINHEVGHALGYHHEPC